MVLEVRSVEGIFFLIKNSFRLYFNDRLSRVYNAISVGSLTVCDTSATPQILAANVD